MRDEPSMRDDTPGNDVSGDVASGEYARCRDVALKLLAVRSRSRSELAQRLRRREFAPAVVRAVLDELEARGWQSDALFARDVVRDRVRFKPRAPVRLRQELQRRGVDDEVAEQAIAEVLADERLTPQGLARDAALGWLRRQGPGVVRALAERGHGDDGTKAERRLMTHLARRGFRGSAAIDALEAARTAALESLEADDA